MSFSPSNSRSRLRTPANLRNACGTVAFALILGLASRSAQAQPPPAPSHRDTATDVGKMALSLYAEKKFGEAYAMLEAADRMEHSPVFVLYMARSKRSSGEM